MTATPSKPALYELERKIAGFDFFPWLVMQKAHGADSVVFDVSGRINMKWPTEIAMQRFESILKPGVALAGMSWSMGRHGSQYGPYHQSDLIRLCASGMVLPRLRSVLPHGKERFTVTLRKTERAPGRNSNEAAWRTFAEEIGALVIPDYADKPMHLHERMALYAGAEMNFFVGNGPGVLCVLSEAPWMQFCVHKSSPEKMGIPFGGRYPFCLPQHHMVWESDTLENIRKHFALWQSGGNK